MGGGATRIKAGSTAPSGGEACKAPRSTGPQNFPLHAWDSSVWNGEGEGRTENTDSADKIGRGGGSDVESGEETVGLWRNELEVLRRQQVNLLAKIASFR